MNIVDGRIAVTTLSLWGRNLEFVRLIDVLYVKAENKYVVLATKEKKHWVEGSIKEIEPKIKGRFVRIHRNCLVRAAQIEAVTKRQEPNGAIVDVVKLYGVSDQLRASRRCMWSIGRQVRA